MTSRRMIFVATVAGAILFAAAARAEKFFPVNDNAGAHVFDQPSVAMNGQTAHVAFIGDNTGTGFKVYYAAVNAGADFTNLGLTRSSILVTPPSAVDNADAGNDAYADARHPVIAMRSATEAVILFQARPATTTDPAFSLYRALVTLDNNAVTKRSVKLVSGVPAGDIEDVSLALVTADNTARVVYASRTAIAPTEPFQLSFSRIGLDNAAAAPPVAITAAYPLSQGYRPLPSLKLDDLNRAHVAWAATDGTGTSPGPVYYAMIKETNGVDNMVIAPSQIMTGRGVMRYTFPNLLVYARNLITVVAGNELSGDLGYVQVNPDEARQDGRSAWDNIAIANKFLPVPPGEVILPPEFRLFRPEALYESTSGRIFLTGYGSGGANPTGASFMSIKINAAAVSADLVTAATPFALGETPSNLAGDYTKAAFGFPGGKIVAFWSGTAPGTTDRNLDVTTVPTVAAWINQSESGCAMVAGRAAGGAGSVPGTVLLFLPAVALAARRLAAGRARRAGARRNAGATHADAGRTVGR